MQKINGLPVFEAVLGEQGMVCISLVDRPAVEKAFQKYSATERRVEYAVADEDRRLVYGVVMRANYPIYREFPDGRGFFIVHSPETIRAMAEQYIRDNVNAFDAQHDSTIREDMNIVQFFIKDSARGIAPQGFEDIEDGSLFAEVHVLNDEVWAKVKDGTLTGFSIEVFEDIVPENAVVSSEKIPQEILDWLGSFDATTFSEKDMAMINKLKSALGKGAEVSAKYGSTSTDKGVLQWDGDEPLKVGDTVYVENESGDRVPAEDGEYTLENGDVIVVVDGRVSEIREAEVAEEEPEVETEMETETEGADEELDNLRAEVDNLKAEIEAKDAEIADLKAEIEKLKAEPAAAPAHDAFRNAQSAPKGGDRHWDNLAAILNA